MTVIKILSMGDAVITDLRNVRATPFIDWEDDLKPKILVVGEPLPTIEEQAAKDAQALFEAQAEQAEQLNKLRRLSVFAVKLAKGPDADQYSALKNASQRQKWLVAHGANLKDVVDLMDLLTPEMAETTKKLALEAQL